MKFLNCRIVLFGTVFLLLGVFVSALICGSLILSICVPLAIFAGGLLITIFTKKYSFLVVCICFCVGVSAFFIDRAIKFDGEIEGEYTIEARVSEANANNRYVVDSVKLNDNKTKGKFLIKGKGLEIGDEIKFTGKVTTLELDVFDSYVTNYISDGVFYEVTSTSEIIVIGQGNMNFFERVRVKICKGIEKYLRLPDAGIVESLIFGDKHNLSYDDKTVINGIGLAHVFAISGLHIGFIAGVVLYLLKKWNTPHLAALLITTAILLLYGALTGFPAGAKRAIIMMLVTGIAKVLPRKNDPITTLSIAVGIIVLTNPTELFDIGMIMSVSAVLGILIFYTPLLKVLVKICKHKVYVYFAKILATTITANLFVIPITFNVFNVFNVISPLGNIVILPFISVFFILIAILSIATAITSSAAFYFYYVRYPLFLVRKTSELLYSIPYSTITVNTMPIATIFYLLALFLLFPHFNIPNKIRYPLSGASMVAFLLCAIFI